MRGAGKLNNLALRKAHIKRIGVEKVPEVLHLHSDTGSDRGRDSDNRDSDSDSNTS